MSISSSLLPEFDQELATTRRLLALVRDADLAFRPHPRSWTLGELALHLANLPWWATLTLEGTEFDVNPPGGLAARKVESSTATLHAFDENVARARSALARTADADLLLAWTLKSGGKSLFSMPRVAVLRGFVLNHLIHHRGQLTVYLRMCDVPLPPIYGPTADTAATP